LRLAAANSPGELHQGVSAPGDGCQDRRSARVPLAAAATASVIAYVIAMSCALPSHAGRGLNDRGDVMLDFYQVDREMVAGGL
jgi:hypothetical protein